MADPDPPDPLDSISTTRKPRAPGVDASRIEQLPASSKFPTSDTKRQIMNALPASTDMKPAPVDTRFAEINKHCLVIRNRRAKVSDRAISITLVDKLGISTASEAALTQVLLDHDDDDRLRVLAAIMLGNASPPPPGVTRAMHKAMLDHESSTVHLGKEHGGGTLQTLAAELLLDLPGGRGLLEVMARNPTGPDYFPWMLAVKMVLGGDSDNFLPLITDIATDDERPVELRVSAIVVLGGTISEWDEGFAQPGWDTITSLSLAKSEHPKVRKAAAEVLKLAGRVKSD